MNIRYQKLDNEDYEQLVNDKFEEIKKDREFYQHLLSIGFNDALIIDNISAVMDYFNDFKYNKTANVLDENEDHYVRKPVIVDGKLTFEYDLCDKYKKVYKVKNMSKICDIPQEMLSKTVRDIDKQSNRSDYIRYLFETYKKYEPKFVFVRAKKNSGCTFITSIFYKEILAKHNLNGNFLAGPMRFTELSNMMFDMKQKTKFEEEINELASCDFLVINKISNFNFNEYTRDNILFPILERRVSSRLTTIFTSELEYNDFMSLLTKKKANDVRFKQIKELLDDFDKFDISINFKLY